MTALEWWREWAANWAPPTPAAEEVDPLLAPDARQLRPERFDRPWNTDDPRWPMPTPGQRKARRRPPPRAYTSPTRQARTEGMPVASRRPVRRRRIGRRRSSGAGPVLALVAAAVLLLLIVRTVSQHPLGSVLLVLLLAGGGLGGYLVHQRQRQARTELRTTRAYTLAEYHRMTPPQFERALAELCRRDGCTRVRVVGGAGDLGADVIAVTPAGLRLVLQAKRYAPSTKVGSGDVQKVGGTARQIHGADIAAVVTTSTFTRNALDYSRRLGIRTCDGTALAGWASRTGPAPWE